jgi:son of sevenless-like protein
VLGQLVKLRKQLEQLREVTHPDKNFAKLREHVHNSNPPIIPYLGTYLSDLTFIDDGNPNTIVEDGIELINFFKQRLSAEFILEVQQYQQQGYNIDRDSAISNYLRQYQPLGEKELFDTSLEIEPREKS